MQDGYLRKIKFSIGIGLAGCKRTETVEYYHEATNEEIEEDYMEWRNNYLDGGWWDANE